MKNINNLNIWKNEEKPNKTVNEVFFNTEITELNLGVRSFNCLKRAGCDTIGEVLAYMDEDGQGLRRIRNLGSRSETEILEKISEFEKSCTSQIRQNSAKKVAIIKPAKKIWDCNIEEFHLSNYALTRLRASGIRKVKDLYATNPQNEPGWYAVRELFEKIPSCR